MKTVKTIGIGFLVSFVLIVVVGLAMAPKQTPAPKKEISAEAWKRSEERQKRKAQDEARWAAEKFEEKLSHYGTALRDYAREHPDTEEYWDVAAARKIRIGMPAELVQMAWGRPERINDTVTANRNHSQWVYGLGQYVYFENGVCTSFQTSR